MIALEKDLIGLIWLSKIKIVYFVFLTLFLGSCTFNKKNNSNKETVNYYNGVVLDEENKPIKNVKVIGFETLREITFKETFTDNEGYFEIKHKIFKPNSDTSENSILIFNKKGYVNDTIETCRRGPSYKRFEIYCYFNLKKPDTMFLKKLM